MLCVEARDCVSIPRVEDCVGLNLYWTYEDRRSWLKTEYCTKTSVEENRCSLLRGEC